MRFAAPPGSGSTSAPGGARDRGRSFWSSDRLPTCDQLFVCSLVRPEGTRMAPGSLLFVLTSQPPRLTRHGSRHLQALSALGGGLAR
jgi:hypothetical protein